jgi:NAD(P)H-flavin reductase
MPTEPLVALAGPTGAAGADAMATRPFRVRRRHRETADTMTLRLEPARDAGPGPGTFAAGQFCMLYAFGVGEVPISISGDPADTDGLTFTIRAVGGVTRALAGTPVSGVVGVRGPYGTGWDVEGAAGGTADGAAIGADVVVVAGGIGLAPLRPVVAQLFAARSRYRRVHLLYGARTPADLLYGDQIRRWAEPGGLDVQVTVDRADASWAGRVGLVTAPIADLDIDPRRTVALVCGPEVMMRHVTEALRHNGIPPGRIRLSVERAMRCGVGLCGHCQLRELFLCVDGPVVTLDRAAPLLRTREL